MQVSYLWDLSRDILGRRRRDCLLPRSGACVQLHTLDEMQPARGVDQLDLPVCMNWVVLLLDSDAIYWNDFFVSLIGVIPSAVKISINSQFSSSLKCEKATWRIAWRGGCGTHRRRSRNLLFVQKVQSIFPSCRGACVPMSSATGRASRKRLWWRCWWCHDDRMHDNNDDQGSREVKRHLDHQEVQFMLASPFAMKRCRYIYVQHIFQLSIKRMTFVTWMLVRVTSANNY